MSFQHPSFLWALLLLVIPILIHLFNFRRYKKVVFSNVEMLRDIQTQSKKTRQIKKWLVLLSRLLALACLVIAFAVPYIPAKNAVSGRNLVSIYLDNSYSMNAEGQNGQSFELAKNLAREVVSQLPQESEIQLIDNNLSPFSRKIQSKQDAIKLIDDLEISSHANSIEKAVQTYFQANKSNSFAQGQLFLISDFQKQQTNEILTDSNSQYFLIPIRHEDGQNVSIDSVWLESPISKPGAAINLNVRVTNHGSSDVPSTTIELMVNGIQQGVETFALTEKESKIMTMSFSTQQSGWLEGQVSINDVPVTFDNRYFFALKQKEYVEVLAIGKSSNSIQKVFGNDNTFKLSSNSATNIDYAGLGNIDLIILNELPEISSGLAEQLEKHVRNGLSVCVIPPSTKPNYSSLNQLTKLTGFGKLSNRDLSVSNSNLKHPFWRGVYKSTPKNMNMPKVLKSYDLVGGNGILTLKDGSTVLERNQYGKGKIFRWSGPFNKDFNAIENHELFVNAFLQMAFGKSVKQQIAYSLNTSKAIEMPLDIGIESGLRLTKNDVSTLVESSNATGEIRYWLNNEIADEGIYKLETKQEEILGKLALNNDRAESSQDFNNEDELSDLFKHSVFEIIDDSLASIKQSVKDASAGKPLWKLFVILCLVFLLMEILLLRFYKT